MQLLRRRKNAFDQKENVGRIFLTPYLRIVPMHLMILLPNILDMSVTVVFLILKTMADIAMYMVTTRMHSSSQPL